MSSFHKRQTCITEKMSDFIHHEKSSAAVYNQLTKGSLLEVCVETGLSGHDNIADIWRLWQNAESNFVAITRELTGFLNRHKQLAGKISGCLVLADFAFLPGLF